MDFDAARKGVEAARRAVDEARCPKCGGNYILVSQALCYSDEDKCMVDIMTAKCVGCGLEKDIKVLQHYLSDVAKHMADMKEKMGG